MAKLVTKRYATALFDIAKEQGAMEEYKNQATMMRDLFVTEQDYVAVISHPSVLLDDKIGMIEAAFKGKVADELVGLLVLVIKKERQEFIVAILNAFIDMANKEAGIVKATVTSAVALNEDQLAQIKANIEKSTKKQIELESLVDASIMGGLVIRVGDKVVDGSIKGQMTALQSTLSDLRLA